MERFEARDDGSPRRPAITRRQIEFDEDLQPQDDGDAPGLGAAIGGALSTVMWLGTAAILAIALLFLGVNHLFGVNLAVMLRDYKQNYEAAAANATAVAGQVAPQPTATPGAGLGGLFGDTGAAIAAGRDDEEQVPIPLLPTTAPIEPRAPQPTIAPIPTLVPTLAPMPTAEILPQPTQPEAVTVVAMPAEYTHPDTGMLYTPAPANPTPEPLPAPPPPPAAGAYRVVTVLDIPGATKQCVVVGDRRICDLAGGIDQTKAELYAGYLISGLMPGDPHNPADEVQP